MAFSLAPFDPILCNICGEMIAESSYEGCTNCRMKFRQNYRESYSDFFDDNLYDEDDQNDIIDILPKEVLKTQTMTLSLYKKGNDGQMEPYVCCICRENIELGAQIFSLSCDHCFHKECISEWFKEKPECPYCRKVLNINYEN